MQTLHSLLQYMGTRSVLVSIILCVSRNVCEQEASRFFFQVTVAEFDSDWWDKCDSGGVAASCGEALI